MPFGRLVAKYIPPTLAAKAKVGLVRMPGNLERPAISQAEPPPSRTFRERYGKGSYPDSVKLGGFDAGPRARS